MGQPLETASKFPTSSALRSGEAERRQLTVMFCDLVGSTELSARLDPEDLREVIGAYHRAVTDIVAGFDGFVSRYTGDGVLVYFGYPQAHEDDAERAVRAGLGAISAVDRLDLKSVKLQTRIGIATGLVVVGDLIGGGSAQEQSVVGETPNLAALASFGRAEHYRNRRTHRPFDASRPLPRLAATVCFLIRERALSLGRGGGLHAPKLPSAPPARPLVP
jgi:hypothetical protein